MTIFPMTDKARANLPVLLAVVNILITLAAWTYLAGVKIATIETRQTETERQAERARLAIERIDAQGSHAARAQLQADREAIKLLEARLSIIERQTADTAADVRWIRESVRQMTRRGSGIVIEN